MPQVTIIAARRARLTHAFVLLADNLRQHANHTPWRTPTNATALLVPCAQNAAQKNQLADVIGVVVDGEQDLTENRLAVAVRNFRE